MNNSPRRLRKGLATPFIVLALFLGSLGGFGAIVIADTAQPTAVQGASRQADDPSPTPTPTLCPTCDGGDGNGGPSGH